MTTEFTGGDDTRIPRCILVSTIFAIIIFSVDVIGELGEGWKVGGDY